LSDITEAVQTREGVAQSHELLRLAVVVAMHTNAITVQNLEGRHPGMEPERR